MKKNLLFTFIFISGILISNAQSTRYGMRIGGNISSISSDDITGDFEDGRFGVAVGFFAEYYVGKTLSIQPEIQYSTQGNSERAVKVDYLQLPVMFKINISPVFNFQVGPQASLKIWEWEDKQPEEFDFNTFDFSAVVGFGVNITDNFFIDARYAYGFTNIFEDTAADVNPKGNNRNIQIAIGFRL